MASVRQLTAASLNSGSSAGGSGFSSTSKAVFPSPFLDVIDLTLPRDIKAILRACESVYFYNPIAKAGIDRLVAYPITSFSYDTDNDNLKKKYAFIHNEVLDLKNFMIEMGKDCWVYGNSFVSPYFPFDRFLKCPACKMEHPIRRIKYRFNRYKFSGTCQCGYSGAMDRIDRRSMDMKRMRMIRWNPHYIFILHNDISGTDTYWYQLDGEMRSKIIAGDPDIIADTPWEFIVAVQKGQKFKFKSDMIFHIKQPTLAGRHRSWGLPALLPLLKLHYFTAALRRANIAIAYDLAVPFRIMYPERGGAIGDPATQLNLKKWVQEAQQMVRQHRVDPTMIKFAPNPVGYTAAGGEARALLYSQEIRQANEEIMAALHIPQDMFYGTLTAQAAPIALRMLYNVMSYYLNGLQGFFTWTNRHVSEYFDIEYVPGRLQDFVKVDDAVRRSAVDTLGAMGKVSDETLMEAYGLDAETEYRKKLKEMRRYQELEAESQKDSLKSETGPAPTPADLIAQAQQLAASWISMPYEQRRSAMHQAQTADPVLYQQALSELKNMRQQARSEGALPGQEAQFMGVGQQQMDPMQPAPGQAPMQPNVA